MTNNDNNNNNYYSGMINEAALLPIIFKRRFIDPFPPKQSCMHAMYNVGVVSMLWFSTVFKVQTAMISCTFWLFVTT